MKWISPDAAFESAESYQWLDVRPADQISQGFVSGSLCFPAAVQGNEIYLEFLDMDKPVCVVLSSGQQELLSLFTGKFSHHSVALLLEQSEQIPRKWLDVLLPIDIDEFGIDYRFDEFYLIDVRNTDAYLASHLEDSDNLPLEELILQVTDLEPEMRIYLIGSNPDESMLAASYLKQNGIPHVRVLEAPWEEVVASGLPVVSSNASTAQD